MTARHCSGLRRLLRRHQRVLTEDQHPAKPWTRTDVYADRRAGRLHLRPRRRRRDPALDDAQRPADAARRGPGPERAGTTCASARSPTRLRRLRVSSPTRPRPRTAAATSSSTTAPSSPVREPSTSYQRRQASNFLIINAENSRRPAIRCFVAGPQIGYFYPGLTGESTSTAAASRPAAAVSAFGPYVFIGRGADFAWSLTSAGSDVQDQFAEELCEGSDTKTSTRASASTWATSEAGTLKGSGGKPTSRSTSTRPSTARSSVRDSAASATRSPSRAPRAA